MINPSRGVVPCGAAPYLFAVSFFAGYNAGNGVVYVALDILPEAFIERARGVVLVVEPHSEHYFNFEINCIGTILAARRLSRNEKEYLSDEQMQRVVVRSSLPASVPYEGKGAWSIELEITFEVIGIKGVPEVLEGNFYKCGDNTPIPHFVSWSPILTSSPDFHRPDFFGEIKFK